MKVLKFGGTSLGSPERMHAVADLINKEEGKKIVVLSAVSGTTNTLVSIATALSKQDNAEAGAIIEKLYDTYQVYCKSLLHNSASFEKGLEIVENHFSVLRAMDKSDYSVDVEKEILAQGELLSTKLFVTYLEQEGVNAVLLPALEYMRINDANEPDTPYIAQHLKQLLSQYPEQELFVTQGYICLNSNNRIDNLQRGGSDYTASLVGEAVKATEIQIWTDIDGMHNNDPRIVKHTYPIPRLSFDEAAELAYFGAKILHPSSIRPAQHANIPVKLLNTMKPDAAGTIITADIDPERGFTAVAAKDGITAIKVKSSRMLLAYGFLRKVFEIFENYKTPIDLITTSEVAVSLTIDNNTHLSVIKQELEDFGDVEVHTDHTIICIVGNMPFSKVGMLKQVLDAMNDIPIRMVSYGGSKFNISLLIDSEYKAETLTRLNEKIFGQQR
ncbi:aspartate kinase [Catalinimonas alkaloidigena]|uniref:aspartate kinase n=1 Tax=Catalinimonas alkaloidigena TaxID=1075417 RepID=UPI0024050790|nr:aspartate kinase [Catalinimonas alkaloidigena]MDF9799857.1 aspartate kinase [Catalinimonas alkaloidigena]